MRATALEVSIVNRLSNYKTGNDAQRANSRQMELKTGHVTLVFAIIFRQAGTKQMITVSRVAGGWQAYRRKRKMI